LNVPFFPNPDDTHCFQACLRSVLKYFRFAEEYNWNSLEELSGKRPGKWTWPLHAISQLYKVGFQAEIISNFDYSKFIENPNEYLLSILGAELALQQVENSDIFYEVEVARKYSSLAGTPKIPSIEDLKAFHQRGFLTICNVNLPQLYGESGYLGHFVIPTAIGNDSIVFHDPGIQTNQFPPRENSTVAVEQFKQAWASSNFVVGFKDK